MAGPPRLQHIEALLRRRGACSVEQLARTLAVSEMTVRRDLAALARAGRVIRTHGGATPGEKVLFEFQFLQRAHTREAAKAAIARAAAGLVRDGQSVLMDSGTTTLAVAHELRARTGLTVITTSLPIAAALQHAPGVQVLLLGGLVRREAPDLMGALTEANLEQLQADVALIGVDGIDLRGIAYSASLDVARMLRRMAAAARSTYVLADSSKIGHTALARIGRLSAWAGLVTDAEISRLQAAALRRAGGRLTLAPLDPQPQTS